MKKETQKKIEAQANAMREECEAEISRMTEEVSTNERMESYDKCATELHAQYTSFVNAGFTEEQAWELVKTIVSNGTRPRSLFS